jgi:hypothetical protein
MDTKEQAWERGVKAVDLPKDQRKNPYPKGSDQAKAYKNGLAKGQRLRRFVADVTAIEAMAVEAKKQGKVVVVDLKKLIRRKR